MKKFNSILVLSTLGVIFLGAASEPNFIIGTGNSSRKIEFFEGDKTIKKEFNVKPGGKVVFDLETGGEIEIQGWSKEVISIKADIRGWDAEDIRVDIEQDGDEIRINSYYEGDDNDHSSDQKIFVNVPEKFNVDFSTMGGDVKINKVSGSMEGKTMGGELDLTNLKGDVNMVTMGGKINVRDCEVNGKVKTMGGQVLVENVTGDLDASSMGGKVIQRNVKGNKNSIGKEVNISTMGGEIDVDSAPNGCKVKTMGGDITINSAAIFVDAITYGGDIEIKEVDGKVNAKTMGGNIDLNMIGKGDGKDIDISSLGGDITLTLPADFSMDVYVEIAFTKEWNRKHKGFEEATIDGDFKLNEQRSDEWEYSHGSPRKYLRGKGEFNGGKNKVVVKTINGTVNLKKS